MKVHQFDSTSEAYDATQCDESVKDGDILVIKSEKVVGLATTWPFAISKAHGALHALKPGIADDYLAAECRVSLAALQQARLMASANEW